MQTFDLLASLVLGVWLVVKSHQIRRLEKRYDALSERISEAADEAGFAHNRIDELTGESK